MHAARLNRAQGWPSTAFPKTSTTGALCHLAEEPNGSSERGRLETLSVLVLVSIGSSSLGTSTAPAASACLKHLRGGGGFGCEVPPPPCRSLLRLCRPPRWSPGCRWHCPLRRCSLSSQLLQFSTHDLDVSWWSCSWLPSAVCHCWGRACRQTSGDWRAFPSRLDMHREFLSPSRLGCFLGWSIFRLPRGRQSQGSVRRISIPVLAPSSTSTSRLLRTTSGTSAASTSGLVVLVCIPIPANILRILCVRGFATALGSGSISSVWRSEGHILDFVPSPSAKWAMNVLPAQNFPASLASPRLGHFGGLLRKEVPQTSKVMIMVY